MSKSEDRGNLKKKQDALVFSEGKYGQGRERLQAFKMAMLEWVPKTGGLSLLDLGCGSGEMSARLAELGHRVIGIDISENALHKYNQRGYAGIKGDLEGAIPFVPQKFDLLWCSEVIEHLIHPEKFLAECLRLLKPGGQLLLSTPNSGHYVYRTLRYCGIPWEKIQHSGHRNFFTYTSIMEMIQDQGFKVLDSLGYNIYIALPVKNIPGAQRNAWYGKVICALLKSMGFRLEEGLIRGDKWILGHLTYWGNKLFSTNILLKITKPDFTLEGQPTSLLKNQCN